MDLALSPFAPERFADLPDVQGVRAATGCRGFYAPRERDDVFLFAFDAGTTTAGVFTRSVTASADVLWCREALVQGKGQARALVVNSGNSNAFTGIHGVTKNEATLAAVTAALGAPKETCFLGATGVIGEPLPDPNFVGEIIPDLADRLAPPHWQACARAFMTTDTFPKGAGARFDLDGQPVNIAGIAKGSGMIAPNMATMLAYVFTDAAIAPDTLHEMLTDAVSGSFNAITVDGDTSTSDSLMVFATGQSFEAPITSMQDPRAGPMRDQLGAICNELALQIVKDGEGISKLISIAVAGAATDEAARQIGVSVANSPLVKTAIGAGDANWGRIVMAVGKAGVPFDLRELKIWFGDHLVAEGGARAAVYDETAASAICARSEVDIRVEVGAGTGCARITTCDLTHAYIDINGAYRT